jgi:hypothetical protein
VVVGALAGPSVLGWVHDGDVLAVLAGVGIILLVLDVGLQIDLGDRRAVQWRGPSRWPSSESCCRSPGERGRGSCSAWTAPKRCSPERSSPRPASASRPGCSGTARPGDGGGAHGPRRGGRRRRLRSGESSPSSPASPPPARSRPWRSPGTSSSPSASWWSRWPSGCASCHRCSPLSRGWVARRAHSSHSRWRSPSAWPAWPRRST